MLCCNWAATDNSLAAIAATELENADPSRHAKTGEEYIRISETKFGHSHAKDMACFIHVSKNETEVADNGEKVATIVFTLSTFTHKGTLGVLTSVEASP